MRQKFLSRFAHWMIKRGSCSTLFIEGQLYLERFYLLRIRDRFAAVLHRFWKGDAYLHCHPWDNLSIILTGGYTEERFDGTTRIYKAGDFAFRQAEVFHRIAEVQPNTWSLFISFKRKRVWGQVIDGRWRPIYRRMDEGFVGNVFPRRKT